MDTEDKEHLRQISIFMKAIRRQTWQMEIAFGISLFGFGALIAQSGIPYTGWVHTALLVITWLAVILLLVVGASYIVRGIQRVATNPAVDVWRALARRFSGRTNTSRK